eukprot:scaffold31738_cov26-Tisochrysis_lutea.AAC.1
MVSEVGRTMSGSSSRASGSGSTPPSSAAPLNVLCLLGKERDGDEEREVGVLGAGRLDARVEGFAHSVPESHACGLDHHAPFDRRLVGQIARGNDLQVGRRRKNQAVSGHRRKLARRKRQQIGRKLISLSVSAPERVLSTRREPGGLSPAALDLFWLLLHLLLLLLLRARQLRLELEERGHSGSDLRLISRLCSLELPDGVGLARDLAVELGRQVHQPRPRPRARATQNARARAEQAEHRAEHETRHHAHGGPRRKQNVCPRARVLPLE